MTHNRGKAMFHPHQDGYFLPANSAAIAACSVLSNRFPRHKDMIEIAKLGYRPCLANGQPINILDISA